MDLRFSGGTKYKQELEMAMLQLKNGLTWPMTEILNDPIELQSINPIF